MTDNDEMDELCQEIGKLILWSNMVDHQLNQSVLKLLVLPAGAMVEPVVALLDIRQKIELLKVRARMLPSDNEWRKKLLGWLTKIETMNGNRNKVAHHRAEFHDGKLVLVSSQLIKIMKSLDCNLKPKPKSDLAMIRDWALRASTTFTAGQVILENLERFYERANAKVAPAKA